MYKRIRKIKIYSYIIGQIKYVYISKYVYIML